MKTHEIVNSLCGFMAGGVAGVGVGAGLGGASAATGALLVPGYSMFYATKAAVIGNAALFGALGAFLGAYYFNNTPNRDTTVEPRTRNLGCCGLYFGLLGALCLGTLIGDAWVNTGNMSAQSTVAATAIGASFIALVSACVAATCCLPCSIASIWLIKGCLPPEATDAEKRGFAHSAAGNVV